MASGKQAIITDLYVVGHHCESSRDRDVIRQVMNAIDDCGEEFEDYQPVYQECQQQDDTPSYIGKKVAVISDNCRIPKGTLCIVVQWISPALDFKNFYIRNWESDYCCWASAEDLKFLS